MKKNKTPQDFHCNQNVNLNPILCTEGKIGIMSFYIDFQTGRFSSEASQHWQLTQWLDWVQTVWTVQLCRLLYSTEIVTVSSCQSGWRRDSSTSTKPQHCPSGEEGNVGTDWTEEVWKSQVRSLSQFFTIEDPLQESVCNQEALEHDERGKSERLNVQIIISINPLGTINISTKLLSKPSSHSWEVCTTFSINSVRRTWDISLNGKICPTNGTRERSENHKSCSNLWENVIYCM